VTLNFAETSVVKSRPSDLYGVNLFASDAAIVGNFTVLPFGLP